MLARKSAVREMANEIDKEIRKIDQITQSEIDRVSDQIDSELKSCGRELTNAQKTLSQVQPLIDRLVQQVGAEAPPHVNVLVTSIAQEVMSKVEGSISNLVEVQKNIQDVDQLTDKIDKLTDQIDEVTDKIDSITDKYQK